MKKIFFVLMLILSISVFSCKKGTGQMTLKFESRSNSFSAENAKQTEEIYKKRMLAYGIDEDDIAISSNGNVISVIISEVSNYKNLKGRVTRLLSGNAHLGFWETYSQMDFISKFQQMTNPVFDSVRNDSVDVILSRFTGLLNIETFKTPELGFETCLIGYVSSRDTAKMMALLDSSRTEKKLPEDLRFAWTAMENKEWKTMGGSGNLYGLIALKSSGGKARLDKPLLMEVESQKDENSGTPSVTFKMEGADADAWKRMTRENIKKCVAITIDDYVYSWPMVQSEISGGVCTISGNFTNEEADDLVAVLKSQALPGDMRLVEVNVLP